MEIDAQLKSFPNKNAGANSFAQKLLETPKYGANAPCAIKIAPALA
jgi:hypothetical protein